MTYYWIGHPLFLTISAGDHALYKKVLTALPVEKTQTQFQMITHLSMYPIP